MKVLYIFQSVHAFTILDKMIIPQLEQGDHGAQVGGMFFFGDTTFLLLPESPLGQRLVPLADRLGFFLVGCDFCCQQRGISGRLAPRVEEGCFPDVYRHAAEHGVEQVISL